MGGGVGDGVVAPGGAAAATASRTAPTSTPRAGSKAQAVCATSLSRVMKPAMVASEESGTSAGFGTSEMMPSAGAPAKRCCR